MLFITNFFLTYFKKDSQSCFNTLFQYEMLL